MSYTYDSLNRLSTVVDNRLMGNQTTTYTYHTANNVATVTYPNGVQALFQYDALESRQGFGHAADRLPLPARADGRPDRGYGWTPETAKGNRDHAVSDRFTPPLSNSGQWPPTTDN